MSRDEVDVLVIGGGPGGSTAAALLAKAGLRVLLLERDRFLRCHISESLLASCQSTLKRSGAYDAGAAHGVLRQGAARGRRVLRGDGGGHVAARGGRRDPARRGGSCGDPTVGIAGAGAGRHGGDRPDRSPWS